MARRESGSAQGNYSHHPKSWMVRGAEKKVGVAFGHRIAHASRVVRAGVHEEDGAAGRGGDVLEHALKVQAVGGTVEVAVFAHIKPSRTHTAGEYRQGNNSRQHTSESLEIIVYVVALAAIARGRTLNQRALRVGGRRAHRNMVTPRGVREIDSRATRKEPGVKLSSKAASARARESLYARNTPLAERGTILAICEGERLIQEGRQTGDRCIPMQKAIKSFT